MPNLEEELRSVVGPTNLLLGNDIDDRYRQDVQAKYKASPSYVARPADTAQVAEIIKIAARHRIPVVPLSGRTGVVGGGTCKQGEIIVSLERMNKVIEVDEDTMTMTVEAGVPLQKAQEEAEAKGFLLPLDLGSRGSCCIGGNIATNAGGNRVLRWGTTRDMVLGLEAVLADGTVVSSLGKFIKDNAGYHWKDLLVGSEGTLGIVTRAVLRLRTMPRTSLTAIVAMNSFDKVPQLLRRLDERLAGQLSSFELMWSDFYSHCTSVRQKSRNMQPPLPATHEVYALIESMGGDPSRDPEYFETVLADAAEDGIIEDAAIARSERDRANFWMIRDDLYETMGPLAPMTAFDVSLALNNMSEFIQDVKKDIAKQFPSSVAFFYGHAGDGNLHLIVSLPKENKEAAEHQVDELVYGALRKFAGSVSAEHGVGTSKKEFIGYSRSPAELALMRSIKRALDPHNILNPDKILPDAA